MTPPITCRKTTIYSYLEVHDPEYPRLEELWQYLDEALSYDVQNAFFIKTTSKKKYVQDMWDGKKHLFSIKTGRFLSGLLPYVESALKEFNIPYDIVDIRPQYSPQPLNMLSSKFEAREYQSKALKALLKHKRGILFARPRSGKSLVEIMLHNKLGLTPHLSICQSLDIAYQTKRKFEEFLPGVSVGIIGDGQVDIQDVTIATIQSLAAAYTKPYKVARKEKKEKVINRDSLKQKVKDLVEKSKVVWVDEAHHSPADIYKFILENKIYSAEYVIGSSGTPFREDNTDKYIEGLLGPVVFEIDYSTLIDAEFLVAPTIHLIKLPKEFEDSNEYYATIYKKGIVENKTRNAIIQRIAQNLNNKGQTCMILVTKKNHGRLLEGMIKGSKFLHGESKDREETWEKLRRKKLKTLITTLGDEGVDLPNLDANIIASGGESAIKVFQRLRCMTAFGKGTKNEKKHAIVVDFLDPCKYLKRHSRKRKRLYLSEPSFRVVVRDGKK